VLSDGSQISGPPIQFNCSNDTEAVAWAELANEEKSGTMISNYGSTLASSSGLMLLRSGSYFVGIPGSGKAAARM
jgi:hypothetical protein